MSSRKLEDGFGMHNVVTVNGRGKIARSCNDNMGPEKNYNQELKRVLALSSSLYSNYP